MRDVRVDDGKVPHAVQVLPARPNELWPRVFWKHGVRIHCGGPSGKQAAGDGSPIGCLRGEQRWHSDTHEERNQTMPQERRKTR